jgi:LysM repeat protein
MAVKIGHASIDENGKIAGGKVGDQTKKEVCIRDWYSKHWNVYLECTDSTLANAAAVYMEQICSDPNYGYDQNERVTGYTNIYKNAKKVKGAKGEFDCSSLVSACYKLAGLDIIVTNTTHSLRKALLNTGKFTEYTDSSHLLSGKLSKRGGIYLSEGHHTVMVLENVLEKDIPQINSIIYTVVKGDTLSKIAKAFGVTVANLVTWNGIKNPNAINIGQKLKILK